MINGHSGAGGHQGLRLMTILKKVNRIPGTMLGSVSESTSAGQGKLLR
jgi:hypothetical protein